MTSNSSPANSCFKLESLPDSVYFKTSFCNTYKLCHFYFHDVIIDTNLKRLLNSHMLILFLCSACHRIYSYVSHLIPMASKAFTRGSELQLNTGCCWKLPASNYSLVFMYTDITLATIKTAPFTTSTNRERLTSSF